MHTCIHTTRQTDRQTDRAGQTCIQTDRRTGQDRTGILRSYRTRLSCMTEADPIISTIHRHLHHPRHFFYRGAKTLAMAPCGYSDRQYCRFRVGACDHHRSDMRVSLTCEWYYFDLYHIMSEPYVEQYSHQTLQVFKEEEINGGSRFHCEVWDKTKSVPHTICSHKHT